MEAISNPEKLNFFQAILSCFKIHHIKHLFHQMQSNDDSTEYRNDKKLIYTTEYGVHIHLHFL